MRDSCLSPNIPQIKPYMIDGYQHYGLGRFRKRFNSHLRKRCDYIWLGDQKGLGEVSFELHLEE